jgi:signal transduction histidine kinase
LQELVDEQTDALRQSLEQLRRSERLASIGTFAAGIAHEINNPLNSILLAAQCALRGPADQDYAEAFRIITEAAQRGGRIVHGILKFARGIQTERSLDSLNDAVRRAADLVRGYLRAGIVGIELDLCSDLPSIEMNATEIEQVIINLVKNAAEAADRRVHVAVRTEACGDRVRLIVQDDGPGVPAEQLPFIFDPFYTTKQATGGTGLGLSICHGIITEHGGTIGVESQLGAGTRFTIEFPAIAYASPHIVLVG